MIRTKSLLLMLALACVSSTAAAQTPPSEPAPVEAPEAAPVTASEASPSEAPALAPQAPDPEVAAPGVEPAPEAPAASPSLPPQALPALPPAPAASPQRPPRRYVLLPPEKHPLRVRPPRRHGDAGAPFAFGIGAALSWPEDDGYRVAGIGERHSNLDLFASYDVWQPVRPLVLSVGASFQALSSADDAQADLTQRTIQADLMARYSLASWLVPHLRASFGTVGTHFEVHDEGLRTDGADVTFEDDHWGVAGTLGAGLSLRTPTRLFETYGGRLASLSLGVLVEGGYTLAQAAQLDFRGDVTSGLDERRASPGDLDRSAPYLRIQGVVRF